MGRTFRKVNKGHTPPGGFAARILRLETMVFESNAYVVKLVNKKDGPLEDDDVEFLEAAEEFRKAISAEAKTLLLKGVRNGS